MKTEWYARLALKIAQFAATAMLVIVIGFPYWMIVVAALAVPVYGIYLMVKSVSTAPVGGRNNDSFRRYRLIKSYQRVDIALCLTMAVATFIFAAILLFCYFKLTTLSPNIASAAGATLLLAILYGFNGFLVTLQLYKGVVNITPSSPKRAVFSTVQSRSSPLPSQIEETPMTVIKQNLSPDEVSRGHRHFEGSRSKKPSTSDAPSSGETDHSATPPTEGSSRQQSPGEGHESFVPARRVTSWFTDVGETQRRPLATMEAPSGKDVLDAREQYIKSKQYRDFMSPDPGLLPSSRKTPQGSTTDEETSQGTESKKQSVSKTSPPANSQVRRQYFLTDEEAQKINAQQVTPEPIIATLRTSRISGPAVRTSLLASVHRASQSFESSQGSWNSVEFLRPNERAIDVDGLQEESPDPNETPQIEPKNSRTVQIMPYHFSETRQAQVNYRNPEMLTINRSENSSLSSDEFPPPPPPPTTEQTSTASSSTVRMDDIEHRSPYRTNPSLLMTSTIIDLHDDVHTRWSPVSESLTNGRTLSPPGRQSVNFDIVIRPRDSTVSPSSTLRPASSSTTHTTTQFPIEQSSSATTFSIQTSTPPPSNIHYVQRRPSPRHNEF